MAKRSFEGFVFRFPAWALITGVACALALGSMPWRAEELAVIALWTIVVFHIVTLSYLAANMTSAVTNFLRTYHLQAPTAEEWAREFEWPTAGPVAEGIRRTFSLGVVVLLIVSGTLLLAGAFSLAVILEIAVRERHKLLRAEPGDSAPHPASMAVSLVSRFVAPFPFVSLTLVLSLPNIVNDGPEELFDLWRDRSKVRRLCEAFARPAGFIYFAYADSTQREHFAGENGVLAPYRDLVVERDWLRDVVPRHEKMGQTRFFAEPEGWLLAKCEVLNMEWGLPFIAVVKSRRLYDWIVFNDPYRMREGDGSAELAGLELRLASSLNAALGPPTGDDDSPPAGAGIGPWGDRRPVN